MLIIKEFKEIQKTCCF